MRDLYRTGFVTLTLRSGEAPDHVPSHLDVLIGAARPTNRTDGGPVDAAIKRVGGGGRVVAVYHARGSLGKIGEQHVGFDALEEQLGMSRTYKVEIADKAKTRDVLSALRDLSTVEWAAAQQLFYAPLATAVAPIAKRVITDRAREHFARVRIPEAQAIEPGDERTTAAVVDTGVMIGHPEFQRKCLAGYDTVDLGMGGVSSDLELVGDSRGYDYNPRDEVGHGSLVASLIGAQGWQTSRGIAGHCMLLPIRVLAAAVAHGTTKRLGVGALSDINAGMKVAVDLGADVINMSFGTPASSVDPEGPVPHKRVVLYAEQYGCVLVAAAGNSGKREQFYPAAHPEVIAVGSVDAEGNRSRFSTFGPHIALCAPGEAVPGASLDGYQVSSGTSFASPFVAGVAALLVSHAARAGHKLTGPEARRILTESASPLHGPADEVGHGLLDAAAALERLDRELAGGPKPMRKQ